MVFEQMSYGIKKTVPYSFEEAIQKTSDTLKSEGFGIITDIDIQKTFKEKINKEFTRYRILGACNPNAAYQALETELDIGLLLPCNVVVYEKKDSSEIVVAAINPLTMIQITGRIDLGPFADDVMTRLKRAIELI